MKKSSYDINMLEWDTNFFGIKSAKICLNSTIKEGEIKKIQQEISEKKYKFITINNINNNIENNYELRKLNNIFLADVNIQFEKKIDTTQLINLEENIKIVNKFKGSDEILKIAKESFVHSRFFVDKNLKNKELVYEQWTKNAFKDENKYFCYYKKDNHFFGYILFSVDCDDNIIIELLAVSKEYENNGIGTKLIKKVEKYAIENNIKKIKVGTQINNIKAQNFYIKNGFKHIGNNSIYHWWTEE